MTGELHYPAGVVFGVAVDPLPLIDPTSAAKLLGLKRHTLACYRHIGQGPRYYKFGRWIRYARADLLAWAGRSELVEITPVEPDSSARLFVDTPAAARFLTVTRFCLSNYRAEGSGPPFHRHGRRLYYSLAELRDWAKQQRR